MWHPKQRNDALQRPTIQVSSWLKMLRIGKVVVMILLWTEKASQVTSDLLAPKHEIVRSDLVQWHLTEYNSTAGHSSESFLH